MGILLSLGLIFNETKEMGVAAFLLPQLTIESNQNATMPLKPSFAEIAMASLTLRSVPSS